MYSVVNKSDMLEHTLFGINYLEFINRKKCTSANIKSVMDNVLPIFINLGGKLKLLNTLVLFRLQPQERNFTQRVDTPRLFHRGPLVF